MCILTRCCGSSSSAGLLVTHEVSAMQKFVLGLLAVVGSVICGISGDAPAGYYRVQADLLQLQNPLGVRHDGKPCDRLGVCDPVIKVFLDTERPMSAFPGPRYISQYTKIFSAVDQNEPVINKNVSVDICGQPFSKANLRAYVKDDDSFLRLTDDHISDFDCIFSPTPAADEASAQWSKGEPCQGTTQPGKIKLFYRYRVFTIPPEQCRPTPPPQSG
ncbi:uncharacterized protein LOC129590354 [Paramacrobiotus metropolitanus]|uniref:uncharacterized protein LOC129590354 n=1 Tax=Paramacrobiotus metropolitanus TaxID=2943436 RepID=UPI0024459601|nr:uncharacterized protein LOC129590354 [Paramacrobiotus metropolitanus]